MKLLFILLLICPTISVLSQQKAGDLKIEPYVFTNTKKEKVEAEIGRAPVRSPACAAQSFPNG